MELRWVLILAGIAILVLLYLSGKPRKPKTAAAPIAPAPDSPESDVFYPAGQDDAYQADGVPRSDMNYAHPGSYAGHTPESRNQHIDPLLDDQSSAYGNMSQGSNYVADAAGYDSGAHAAGGYHDGSQRFAPPVAAPAGAPVANAGGTNAAFEIDPNDMARPADTGAYPGAHASHHAGYHPNPAQGPAVPSQARQSGKNGGLAGMLGSLGQRLAGKKSVSQQGEAVSMQGVEPKIVTLHVVAPDGQVIHGPRLLSLLDQRNYHFGEMNIFHSLHEDQIVFSVAKMVEPGIFDLNSPASFETPGITMILQLPGPVAANVALDVLIREATEIAEALGCSVLDSGHSTLSGQTIQHLRDSVHQFMHQQKLADAVPS